MTASYLKNSSLWWEGPEWLRQGQNCCPEESSDIEDERRKTNVLLTVEQEETGLGNVIKIERYGSLSKLLRVTGTFYACVNVR